MLINEFTDLPSNDYSISNAVIFHDELNPKLFREGRMRPEVRAGLVEIAKHFEEFIGVDLDVQDITVSGSNAAFSYTPHSDLDLHIVVSVPEEPEYKQLLDAKKNDYNARHDIKVRGIDVELYAQTADEEHHSLGIYSVMNDTWVEEPQRRETTIDEQDVQEKFKNYSQRILTVLNDDDLEVAVDMKRDISRMRQAGLESNGEFGTENLTFKLLRSAGLIEKLHDHINNLQDRQLSIEQRSIQ